MNDIQERIHELEAKGWTQKAIADELEVTWQAVHYWKSGERYPGMPKAVLLALDALMKRKPPKRRRYPGTHHLQREAKKKADSE